jgi:ubiquinone/menaquinone biosynthesis C-methylase UbiE
MALFARRPSRRVPHDEPSFREPGFAARYNASVGKHTADFRPILRYVGEQLDPARPAHVLEIGPGPGWIGIQLALAYPAVRVTGLDVSEAFVAIANENSRREGVADRAVFTLGDATAMNGLADASFDVVCSYQSLHYWDPPERAIDEIARVLKPSGVFCLGDDRRDMNLLGRLQVYLAQRFISRELGAVWAESISGCFTPAEAADALERSALRDRWHMKVGPRSMLITSKARVG